MKINIFTLLVLFIVVTTNSFAQINTGMLKGRIVTINNEPVRGATVQFQHTKITTQTDVDGGFSLNGVPAGTYVLVVSNIGYSALKQNLVIASGKNTFLNLQLSESKNELQEVAINTTKTRYQVKRSNSSTRMDIPLLSTPQSVQVVSSEVMQDR